MEQEIAGAPEEHLMQADEDEWVKALVERYTVEPPELHPEHWWMDPPVEIEVDVRYDAERRFIVDMDRPALVSGFRHVVHVPFTGEADVFKYTPSTRTYNAPRVADLQQGEIVLAVEYPADAPRDVRAETQGVVDNIQRHLMWARGDVETFNLELERRARGAIQTRRQRVREAYERLQQTGIPMRKPDDGPKTYIADVLVRRPSPSRPPANVSQSIALEPVLSDEVFEHILGVIRGAAEAMERSRDTYVGMGEEDRRQVLLTALNTHYRGQTTAEAFNVGGKTDILVRHPEGKNLFIGECKFWEGVKGFSGTVDQLFRYAGWRDTKLAVVMFVREKGLTAVVEKARNALAEHGQFVRWREAAGETELRATMSWPGDEQRHADLNVFFVHVPE